MRRVQLAVDLELTGLLGLEADRLGLVRLDDAVDVEGVDAEPVRLLRSVLDVDVDLVALGHGDRADGETRDAAAAGDGDAEVLGLVVSSAAGQDDATDGGNNRHDERAFHGRAS